MYESEKAERMKEKYCLRCSHFPSSAWSDNATCNECRMRFVYNHDPFAEPEFFIKFTLTESAIRVCKIKTVLKKLAIAIEKSAITIESISKILLILTIDLVSVIGAAAIIMRLLK